MPTFTPTTTVTPGGPTDTPTFTPTVTETPGANCGLIEGYAFNDVANIGIRDAGETGIPGLTVRLKQGATVVGTTTTSTSGYYAFSNLPLGAYTVETDARTDYDNTTSLSQAGQLTNCTKTVKNFGFRPCVTVSAVTDPSGAGSASVTTAPNCPGGGVKFEPETTINLTTAAGSAYFLWQNWTASGGATVGNPDQQTTTLTLGAADVSATAHYAECTTLAATVYPVGAGTLTVAPLPNCGGDRYRPGTAVTLSVTPASGKTFQGWSGDVPAGHTADNPLTVTMDRNRSLTALFEIACYTLAVAQLPSSTAGTVTRTPATGDCPGDTTKYKHGTVVSLTASPATDWSFKNWSGDASGTNPSTTVTMTANRTVTANFESCVAVTAAVSPAGAGAVTLPAANCPGGGPKFKPNTAISISASTNSGYKFDRWSAPTGSFGSASAASTTFTPGTSDVLITANFVTAQAARPAPALALAALDRANVILLNQGAYIYWEYGGLQMSRTNPILHGGRIFLPLVLK